MTAPLLSLSVLGPPRLERRDGAVGQSGPRRLALLAVVAAAGHAGITRDRLLGLLWPDADQDRARHSLTQTLYTLRRDVQAELLIGSTTLRLDPVVCRADIAIFDDAIAKADWAAAVAAYAGPLLDGFFLSDAPEFTNWLDVERDRRHRQAVAAAESLATAAEGTGDDAAASAAWRRAVELDPFSSRLARQLALALARRGDTAGALRHLDQHAALLRRELDATPDAAVLNLAAELRRASATAAVQDAPALAAEHDDPATPLLQAAVENVPAPTTISPGPPRIRDSRRTRLMLGVVGAIAVVAAVIAARRPRVPYAEGEYLMLGDFANLTRDTLLTRVAGVAFAASLGQSAHVALLPRLRIREALERMKRADTAVLLSPDIAREVALRENVPLMVTGEVLEVGTELQITTHLVEASTGREVRTRSRRISTRDELLSALDALSMELRKDLGEARRSVQASIPLPRMTTSSLEALRLYADADRAGRANDIGTASLRLLDAIRLDSSFAQARATYGAYLVRNNRPREAEPHFEAAVQLAEQLPRMQALAVLARVHASRGNFDLAIEHVQASLVLQPNHADTWLQLAGYLRQAGRPLEALAAFDSASHRVPLEAGTHLDIAALWLDEARGKPEQHALFDSVVVHYERAFATQPELLTYLYVNHQYGAALVALGKTDSARAVFSRMLGRAPNDRARGLRSLGYLAAWEGRWRSAARLFGEAATVSRLQKQWTSATRSETLAGMALVLIGEREEGQNALRLAAAESRTHDVETRMARFTAVALAESGDVSTAATFTRWLRESALPDNRPAQGAVQHAEAQLAIAERRYADALQQAQSAYVIDPSAYSRARLASATAAYGDLDRAVLEYEGIRRQFAFGDEEQFAWQLAPYQIGRLHEDRGRTAEAMQAYAEFLENFPASIPSSELPRAVADARARLQALRQDAPKLR